VGAVSVGYLDSGLDTVFDLARRGFHLFPVDSPRVERCAGVSTRAHDASACIDRGKHPCVKWSKEASTDPQQLAAWFTGPPRNIGIACGPSGLVVLDEDVPGDLARYAGSVGATIPETYTVTTGRGSHYYFRAPSGRVLGNQKGMLRDYRVDVRSAGGYVVGPGSLHTTGALYTVQVDVDPVPLPQWLLDALTRSPEATAERGAGGLAAVPAIIAAGSRHDVLMRYASSLRGRNFPQDEALVLMQSVWRRCEQPQGRPMGWPEAEGVLTDVYARYPANDPLPIATTFEPHNEDGADAGPDLSRWFTPGGRFILDTTPDAEPIWGLGTEVLFADGEALILAGGQGLGKTTLGQQIALGRCGFEEYADLLGFPIKPGARRTLYLAMDRPKQAARSFRRMVGEAWRAEPDDRLVVMQGPPPHDLARNTDVLTHLCAKADADTVIVDSLKDAAIGLNDDEVGAGYNRARQTALTAGVQVVELHHNRKTQNGTAKRELTIDDLYGSTWLTSGVGSVLLLTGAPGDAIVTLRHLKQPSDEVGPLRVLHDHSTGRSTIYHAVDLLVLAQQPLSAVEAARQLFDVQTPNANQKKKAERRLAQLVKAGRLRVCQTGSQSTKTPTKWVAT
jgi:hypothetical protein